MCEGVVEVWAGGEDASRGWVDHGEGAIIGTAGGGVVVMERKPRSRMVVPLLARYGDDQPVVM